MNDSEDLKRVAKRVVWFKTPLSTYSFRWRKQSKSPKVVSKQLGHASTAFTLDTYAHVLPHMQDEAAARVEAMLFRQTA